MKTGSSEPKPLERAPEAFEARFEALMSLSMDGIWILDRDGRIQHVNDALCRLLGRKSADILGHEAYEFLPPDTAELARQRLAGMELAPQPAAPTEFRLRHRDGALVEVEAWGRLVPHGDGIWLAVGMRPVGPRKELETALDATQQRLRSTFDSLTEGVVVQDADGHIVDSNLAASRILGLTPEQIAGRGSLDPRWHAVHEDGSPFPGETHPAMRALRTGRSVQEVVMGVHKPDGCVTWISINAVPLFDVAHAVVGAVTSFFDVTQRKASDRKLEAERQLNRRIIETAPFGICIYDEHGDCLAANPAMARDIGASLQQVLAQNYHRIDSWKATGLYELASAALDSDGPLTMTGPFATSFGRNVWLELTCRGLDLDLDGRRGLMLVTRDLTDAKRSEQALEQKEIKYRTLVEQASDGIFIADANGRYTEVNDAGCRMLGYSREEILAMRMDDLVRPEELQLRPLRYDRLRSGNPVLVERQMRRKDGSVLLAEISGCLLPDGNFLGMVRDIGQRKAAEEARRATEVAERANRAKSEFVSRMSHELRTPLNAILGFSELLQIDQQRSLRPAQREQLGHIRKASRHLLKLIDDLLDVSRIEAGAVKLQLEDIDLREILQEALDGLTPEAARAGVRLSLEISPRMNPCVRGDRTRLLQVVANLVSNAIKYNRRGGMVTVRVAASGERLRLSVIDDGPGLTHEQLQRLFQPFDRLGRESSEVEGTGIGLVITRSLAELMGGELSVHSEPGHGSEFVVDLLLAAPAAAAPGQAEVAGVAATRSDVRGRVLYIEDDEVNRLLMQAYLALRPNVQLTVAGDGSSGLQAALAHTPDVVLIDMSLPDMSGLDVLRGLRAHPGLRRIPCIAVSANAMAEDIAAAKAAGMDAYLTKPLSALRLLSTLDGLM